MIIAALVAAVALGVGIIIGHFAIKKPTTTETWKYDRLTRAADPQNYQTYINSIQASNIENNLKYARIIVELLFHCNLEI